MAKVTIESAEVARIIDGWGFKATETTTVQGEERKTWYTVWTKAAVSEGDRVSITGELGVKIEEFTGRDNTPKTAAAIHINNAQVSGGSDAPF
tara:strand:+ start:1366 stop:1644 length:279 start_codon:yes stop_codon:yes gene_type:complete